MHTYQPVASVNIGFLTPYIVLLIRLKTDNIQIVLSLDNAHHKI